MIAAVARAPTTRSTAYGGWLQVTNIQAGGGLYAQRIVTRKHYDLDGAKHAALVAAGLAEGAHAY